MLSYQLFKRLLFRPLCKVGFRARVIGQDNVPTSGGALLAMNHIANMDSVVVPSMLKRELFYPAKAELFKPRGVGSWIVAKFLRAVGMVPMERGGGRASLASLEAIFDVLQQGKLVGIYPEGTRSPDGRLYKGHTGVARMALQGKVPVVPVGVAGTEAVRGLFGIPWVRHPLIVIGKPLDFSAYAGSKDQAVLRWVTDEIMDSIQSITGQAYVDVYGFRVKHGDLKDQDLSEHSKPRPGGNPPPEIG